MRKNKRQDIIESTMALLAKEGIEGFSASAVATHAGVGKATIFHHFPTMNDIVLEAFEQFALGLEMMSPPEEISLRDWLIDMGEASFGLDETEVSLARVYFVFISKALFDDRLRLKMKLTADTVSEIFGNAVVKFCDGMKPSHAKALGNLIFMTADGMAIHLQAFPERKAEVIEAWLVFVDQIAPSKQIRSK